MNVIPHILFTSLFSIIVLFLLAKLMGNRQVSQMSMFDYVNGTTIGPSRRSSPRAWRTTTGCR